MEIEISKHSLLNALSKTITIADRKSSMQILSNVLIEADADEKALVAATDLNISVKSVFPASITSRGAITVPAKTFYDVVRNMPEGLIKIQTVEDHVHLSCERSRFKLVSLPAEDFPQLPSIAGKEFFDIDAALVARMIERTIFSISGDETRSHINGALFQGDGKYLRMVTTDGHRLSKYEIKLDKSAFYNFSFVIPNKGIIEIRRIVEDGTGIVSIASHDGSVFFKREIEIEKGGDSATPVKADLLLVSKLIEADFPPYDQVIPSSYERSIVMSRTLFLDALRRVSVVSTERTLGVTMSLSEGAVEISSDNPYVGQGKEQFDVDYEGESLSIGFNARYFMDVLSVLDSDEIKIELSGSLDPVVIKDISDSFVGVIMPMRI